MAGRHDRRAARRGGRRFPRRSVHLSDVVRQLLLLALEVHALCDDAAAQTTERVRWGGGSLAGGRCASHQSIPSPCIMSAVTTATTERMTVGGLAAEEASDDLCPRAPPVRSREAQPPLWGGGSRLGARAPLRKRGAAARRGLVRARTSRSSSRIARLIWRLFCFSSSFRGISLPNMLPMMEKCRAGGPGAREAKGQILAVRESALLAR